MIQKRKNSIKLTLLLSASHFDCRRSPMIQKSQGIDDPAPLLFSLTDFNQFTSKALLIFRYFSPDRRCFNLTVLLDLLADQATLTALAAFTLLRYFSYQTRGCFSSSRHSGGAVKVLEAGTVNRRTTGRFRQAGITLAGRNFTIRKYEVVYVSACFK